MKYINPYEIANFIQFSDLDTSKFKKFKRRLSAELELNNNEFILNNTILHQNEIYDILDSIDRDKNILNIYNSLYENKELHNFLSGTLNATDIKKLKNILVLEDKQTIEFITPYLIEILSKVYKEAFLNNNSSLLEIEPPLTNNNYEKIYEPIYKLLKNKETELKAIKNNYYDLSDIKEIIGEIKILNALPDYFMKIRSDIAYAIRNLSIDAWNENEDLDLAIDLINLALVFNVNTKDKDKFLSDKDDLENIKKRIVSEKIAEKIYNLEDEIFNSNIVSKVKTIIKNISTDNIIVTAIRDLSIYSWNKKENIEVALELNYLALSITNDQEILKILNKDKKDLEKIKKDVEFANKVQKEVEREEKIDNFFGIVAIIAAVIGAIIGVSNSGIIGLFIGGVMGFYLGAIITNILGGMIKFIVNIFS